MSMNSKMHPRNPYKTPPDFKEMASKYPEFRKHIKLEVSGKISLDFKNETALRALSCTLLKKDFDLDVTVPANKLIPTIPLRMNYILWVEDLLQISGRTSEVAGIDVGTGASCVYPLICARKYGWKMTATEVDDESVEMAKQNVHRNNLDSLIQVKKIEGKSLLQEALSTDRSFDFTMCNPPFFASTEEVQFEFKSRKQSRPRPKNAFSGCTGEVIVKGGEVEFVSKLIAESKELLDKVKIYTSMIGCKANLVVLKKLLRDADVISFKQTEFCQGNTTRWGLAWTYCDIDLRGIPQQTLLASAREKKNKPLHFICDDDINITSDKARDIFNKLEISFEQSKQRNMCTFKIKARCNTWVHQRRKRRALKHQQDKDKECSTQNERMEVTTDLLSDLHVKSPRKREHESDDENEYYRNKKACLSNEKCDSFLEGKVVIMLEDDGSTHLLMNYVNGAGTKEDLYQLFQYLKNHINNNNKNITSL